MGGDPYSRDEYESSSSSSWDTSCGYSGGTSSFGESAKSHKKLSSTTLDKSMQPKGKIMKSVTKTPIVIMLDVTGSNINFARVVYDKLPMFHGQIEQKGYLDDFDIAICAVGDACYDSYPLQIADFAKGIEIDSWIEKTVLEGQGGPWGQESYELAAYWLYRNMQVPENSNPLIFFIADEKAYDKVDHNQAEKVGIDMTGIKDVDGFTQLRQKVKDNVFILLNQPKLYEYWTTKVAGQHVFKIEEEKAIIDLMLGIISMAAGARDLESYKVDMLNRGQTERRITGVVSSLEKFSTALVPVTNVKGMITKSATAPNSGKRGTRL